MKARITVSYGDGGTLARETRDFDIPDQETDEGTFQEALDYVNENIVDPYSDDGYTLEADEDHRGVGGEYLAVWTVTEGFDTRDDADEFLDQFIEDVEAVLSDLE